MFRWFGVVSETRVERPNKEPMQIWDQVVCEYELNFFLVLEFNLEFNIDAQYRRLAVSIEETHQNNSSSAVAKMSDNAKRNHLSIFNGVSLEFLVGDMFAQSAFISNQSTVPSFGIRSYCPDSPYPLMWCHGQKHPPPSWPNLETIVKSTLSYCVLSTNIDRRLVECIQEGLAGPVFPFSGNEGYDPMSSVNYRVAERVFQLDYRYELLL